MRLRLVIIATAGLVGACGASSAQSRSGPSVLCGPPGAQTLASSNGARVYVVHATAYGCAAHGKTSYKLGGRATCIASSRVGPVKVTGELAAYGLERCGVDTGNTSLIVRRLTDGKQLQSTAATSPAGVESYQSITSLVLKDDGAVAWIGVGSSIASHRRLIEVRKADRDGEAVLDAGPAVVPGSMRLHGSTVQWRDGAQTRSATLR